MNLIPFLCVQSQSLYNSCLLIKFPDGLSGLIKSKELIGFSSKKEIKSSEEYEKFSFSGIYEMIFSFPNRLVYSSNEGNMIPTCPSISSMRDLINSDAPLPTQTKSSRTWKYFPASKLLTLSPEGYSAKRTLKLDFSSFFNFLGGK